MAQTGYDRPQPGDPTHDISVQDARQGRNVKGMIYVLVIGIALVVAAYAALLALSSEPVTVDNRAVENVVPTPGPGGAAPAMPETAQSPS